MAKKAGLGRGLDALFADVAPVEQEISVLEKEEAKNTTVEAPIHTSASFKPREKNADKFSDLW